MNAARAAISFAAFSNDGKRIESIDNRNEMRG